MMIMMAVAEAAGIVMQPGRAGSPAQLRRPPAPPPLLQLQPKSPDGMSPDLKVMSVGDALDASSKLSKQESQAWGQQHGGLLISTSEPPSAECKVTTPLH